MSALPAHNLLLRSRVPAQWRSARPPHPAAVL